MTPDELPADMEGRLDHALNKAGRLMHEMNFVGTPNWHLSFDDIRDLLKAYQEQRRALERIASAEVDGLDLERDSMVLTRAIKLARAALNQKGDER